MNRDAWHREIEALERRLQTLLAAGDRATEADRVAWEADQDRLLDRLGVQDAADCTARTGARGAAAGSAASCADEFAWAGSDYPDLDALEAGLLDVQQAVEASYAHGEDARYYRHSGRADADQPDDGWDR
ncbi:hypothetical protein AD006_25275 [Pseudonocardia sp. EC080610-09]|uniref:hypothetical protein n=1 Tax=unclassified Pseudonocardia TaxID=2619320 RepID=UPI0006CB7ED3|nr:MULTISPECIES: hypothetical protein [unclassified Pseudonocardia]ALE74379.1 hypothetical protein FRP1_17830 [Pseudonocardia sp. EC080625-04]ALL77791.1 hypothetical protein AD006_25275 [Pseudonocardia sp. EC080610-09]ALL80706.1 hypothetical protein AD017_04865 [Pseudonocardia sp. EC080619-01]